jgi:hypothetical protein
MTEGGICSEYDSIHHADRSIPGEDATAATGDRRGAVSCATSRRNGDTTPDLASIFGQDCFQNQRPLPIPEERMRGPQERSIPAENDRRPSLTAMPSNGTRSSCECRPAWVGMTRDGARSERWEGLRGSANRRPGSKRLPYRTLIARLPIACSDQTVGSESFQSPGSRQDCLSRLSRLSRLPGPCRLSEAVRGCQRPVGRVLVAVKACQSGPGRLDDQRRPLPCPCCTTCARWKSPLARPESRAHPPRWSASPIRQEEEDKKLPEQRRATQHAPVWANINRHQRHRHHQHPHPHRLQRPLDPLPLHHYRPTSNNPLLTVHCRLLQQHPLTPKHGKI